MAKAKADYLRKALQYKYPKEDAEEIIKAILREWEAAPNLQGASVGNPYVVAVGLI